MAKPRSYKLLCPIARALDRIGDRWTLLILRDLHAGSARFSELQKGLTGIAANLLTERLAKLVEDGLAQKADGGHGTAVYELTDLGRQTSNIIFELAMFGGQFKPEGPVVAPGNLRTVATTMGAAARRVATPEMEFDAAFVVDGEPMHLSVGERDARMTYRECREPDLTFTTSYKALLALSEGEMAPDEFATNHSTLEPHIPGKDDEFRQVMARILEALKGQ